MNKKVRVVVTKSMPFNPVRSFDEDTLEKS